MCWRTRMFKTIQYLRINLHLLDLSQLIVTAKKLHKIRPDLGSSCCTVCILVGQPRVEAATYSACHSGGQPGRSTTRLSASASHRPGNHFVVWYSTKACSSTMWENILLRKFDKSLFVHNVRTYFVGEIQQKLVSPQCENTLCWVNSTKLGCPQCENTFCWVNSSNVCSSTMWKHILLGKFFKSVFVHNVRKHCVGEIHYKLVRLQCESSFCWEYSNKSLFSTMWE